MYNVHPSRYIDTVDTGRCYYLVSTFLDFVLISIVIPSLRTPSLF